MENIEHTCCAMTENVLCFQTMGDPVEDARFSKLGTEKRFRRAGKKHGSKKVKIDSRFQGLFTQEKFVSKCTVDKRGRPR